MHEQIQISDEFQRAYVEHIRQIAGEFRHQLPFTPPFDVVIVGGSGLLHIAEEFEFQAGTRTEIHEKEIGLPTGASVDGHSDVMIAGVTKDNRKVLVKSRVIHPYNTPTLGVDTAYGRLSQTDVATMYLQVIAQLGGSADLILSCACGGIANPTFPGEPPLFRKIPEITIAGSDINFAYASGLMGPYQGLGDNVRFPPSRESGRTIKDHYKASWAKLHALNPQVAEHVYMTSMSTAGYENRAQVLFALSKLYRLVGMSLSAEAETLSRLNIAFPNMLALGVVTNPLLLYTEGGNEALLEVRQKLGISMSDYDHTRLMDCLPLVPSKYELEYMEATQLKIDFPADHEDVKRGGAKAVGILGPVLMDMYA